METIEKIVKLRTYKDLIAWQRAYELCLMVYQLTNSFPKNEQYGLSSQIRRCSLSVPSNIAEGYTRHQTAEYIRFLYIAYASLAELETQLMISKDLGYVNITKFKEVLDLHSEVQRTMYGLIKSLRKFLKSYNP